MRYQNAILRKGNKRTQNPFSKSYSYDLYEPVETLFRIVNYNKLPGIINRQY
jgi:hypothetical protein